jgi:pimeloyl-ACP methyl ester carboxylesterase
MARFVLVHGAFGGASNWDLVIKELHAAGHEVQAIDLPGGGDDATPVGEVTLDAYAERICAALAEGSEPAVLVGHSMGGVAITHAAGRCPERVSLLVYVAAFLPRDGQSLLDLAGLPEGADDQVQANMVVEGAPPVATMPDAAAGDALFGACTDEQVAWGVERLRPQPVVPFTQPVSLSESAADGLARAYVLCNRDRAIPPALQRRMVRESPCAVVVELDTDHSPWLSATGDLVAALDRFATDHAR